MSVFMVDTSKLPQSGHERQARGAAVPFLVLMFQATEGRRVARLSAHRAPRHASGWHVAAPASTRNWQAEARLYTTIDVLQPDCL
jgi:hypothetical protein